MCARLARAAVVFAEEQDAPERGHQRQRLQNRVFKENHCCSHDMLLAMFDVRLMQQHGFAPVMCVTTS